MIVLSIALAFTLDNWNDERKERKKEIVMLEQLHEAIRQDSVDYAGNLTSYNRMAFYSSKLLTEIGKPSPNLDSVKTYLPVVIAISIFINNRAPYESLKSIGFDIISNDSLRLSVVHLYEITYNNYILKFEEDVNTAIKTNAVFNSLTPVDKPWEQLTPSEVRAAVRLLRMPTNRRQLAKLRNRNYTMSFNYKHYQPEQTMVLANISREIRRLKSL